MLKRILLSSFIILQASLCFSQTLHTLLFVNEQEPGREIDRKADMSNMYYFWRDVARKLGYTYSPIKCSPSSFTAANIDTKISGLSISNNDIVVFYYSGHGYNDESDIWPSLNLLDKNYRQIEIMKKLKRASSNAKLVLCIADCCNKQYNSSYDLTAAYDAMEDNNAINHLFTGFKGKKSIIVSASKQGQFSWSHTQKGAFFGMCFRHVISHLSTSKPTWDVVLRDIVNLTYRCTNGKQTPQYNVTQSGDPFED